MHRRYRPAAVAVGVLLLLGLLAAPAAAHVDAVPSEADSPSFRVAFRVSHGCAGSPTTGLRVRIPEGVDGPRPEVAAGWEIELVREDAEAAAGRPVTVPARYTAHDEDDDHDHGPPAGRVTEVAWVGGSLSDEHIQDFALVGRFTDEAPDVVYFPVVQECAEGEHRWIDIPANLDEWDDLDEPAPYVRLAFRDFQQADAPDGEETADAVTEPEPDPPAEEEGAAADVPDAATPPPADRGGVDPLALAGLVAGLLGLGAGGLALARTRSGARAG